MASNSKISNEKNLEVIARKQSINFDKGQTVVSKYFDDLIKKIKKTSKSPKIFEIFSRKKTDNIKGIYIFGVNIFINGQYNK